MSPAETAAKRPRTPREGRRAALRRFVPWEGTASRADLALMGAILGVVVLGQALRPLEPFLLASHPLVLEFLTGDPIAIGAAAALARVGEVELWLVVVVGAAGMVKLDWLAWWMGRQWGGRILRMLTTGERTLSWATRARDLDRRVLAVAVVLAVLPGVPSAIAYVVAGWAGMRLAVFLLLDLVGAGLMTGLVAGLGYALGEHAVRVVLLVDRYASLVSLGLIALALVPALARALARRVRRNARGGRRKVADDG